jgi:hypothetical protein
MLTHKIPCDANFSGIYWLTFDTPAFITLRVNDNIKGNNLFYQLDELFTDGFWYRQLGVAVFRKDLMEEL